MMVINHRRTHRDDSRWHKVGRPESEVSWKWSFQDADSVEDSQIGRSGGYGFPVRGGSPKDVSATSG